MKVQMTVDDDLWKKAKASAALKGVTLGELVGEALGKIATAIVEPPKPAATASSRPKVDLGSMSEGITRVDHPKPSVGLPSVPVSELDVEQLHRTCFICKEQFAQTDMQYHAKTMKWVCNGCVENQKNGQ